MAAISAAATALAGLASPRAAHANSYSWIGASGGTWGTPTNWSGNVVPSLSDELTVLGPFNADGSLNINVAASASAKSINFTNIWPVALSRNAGSSTLTLGTGGLTVGAGAVSIVSPLDIAMGANQSWNVGSGGLTVSNTSGAFNLTKAGPGTLTLAGASTYTGTTTIESGVAQFANPSSLYNSNVSNWTASKIVVASGATLELNVGGSTGFTVGQVAMLTALGTATGGFTNGATIALNTDSPNGDVTYSNAITNPNGGSNTLNLTKLGADALILNAANSYTGTTTIGVPNSAAPAGAIVLSGNGSINGSSAIAIYGFNSQNATGNTLELVNNTGPAVDRIKDTATVTLDDGGALTLLNTTNTNMTETVGAVQFTHGAGIVSLNQSTPPSLTLSASRATGSIVRTNNATGVIKAYPSLGVASTSVAKLRLGDNGASMGLVGSTTANNLSPTDATLNLKISGFLFGDEASGGNTFVTYDAGLGTVRALETSEFAPSIDAAINGDQNVRVTASASGIATNTINSLLCPQSVTLSGASGGVLTINSGVIYGPTTGGANINGFAGIVLKNGEGVIGTGTADNYVNGSGFSTISSPITITSAAGTGNSGSLTKFGNSVLILTATENYSGQTTINQGTLSIGDGSHAGDITSSSNIVVNAGANLTFNPPLGIPGSTYSTVISGSGSVTKSGSGTVTLAATSTYTGPTIIADANFITPFGPLVITGSISGTSSVTIGNSTSYGVLQVNTPTSNPLGTGLISFAYPGGLLQLIGGVSLPNAMSLAGSPGTKPAIESISGDSILTGALTLGSGVVFSSPGASYIVQSDAGLLTIGNNITYTLTYTDTLNLQGSGDGLVKGVIADNTLGGTLALVKAGAGTWTLNGNNTYAGTTTVNAGTLLIAGGLPAATSLTVNAGGAAHFSSSAAQTIASLAGAAGAVVTIDNGRTLTITTGGSFPGTINVSGKVNLPGNANSTAATTRTIGMLNLPVGGSVSLGASVAATFPLTLQATSMTLGGTIDIANNVLVAPGQPSDAESFITHHNVITSNSHGLVLGYGDAGGGNFEIRATLLGDSNLDGQVTVTDLGNLAGSFGVTTNATWINGDFDYNGTVDVSDLGDLAGNFGNSLSGSSAAIAAALPATSSGATVPEPTTLATLLAGSFAMLRPRPRRWCQRCETRAAHPG